MRKVAEDMREYDIILSTHPIEAAKRLLEDKGFTVVSIESKGGTLHGKPSYGLINVAGPKSPDNIFRMSRSSDNLIGREFYIW